MNGLFTQEHRQPPRQGFFLPSFLIVAPPRPSDTLCSSSQNRDPGDFPPRGISGQKSSQPNLQHPEAGSANKAQDTEKLSIRTNIYNSWKKIVKQLQATSVPSDDDANSTCHRTSTLQKHKFPKEDAPQSSIHTLPKASTSHKPTLGNPSGDDSSETQNCVSTMTTPDNRGITIEQVVIDQGISTSMGWAAKFSSNNTGESVSSHCLVPQDPEERINLSTQDQREAPGVKQVTHSPQTHSKGQPTERFLRDLECGRLGIVSSNTSKFTKGEAFKTAGLRGACFAREKAWGSLKSFFDSAFMNPKEEEMYQREAWYQQKRTSLYGSAFYVLNWLTSVAFGPRPFDTINTITIFGIAPVLCAFYISREIKVGLVLSIIYNLPQRTPLFYQIWLWFSTWSWTIWTVVDIEYCGYYNVTPVCGSKDFIGFMYSAIAIPSIAILGMGMNKIFHFTGSVVLVVLIGVFAAPHAKSWLKILCNFCAFSLCVLIVHRMRERVDRRLWRIRNELKKQYKTTQKAQIAEAKSNDSKRRFTSYIFHEIRVPLNTALLALQNLENRGVFSKLTSPNTNPPVQGEKSSDEDNIEWQALVSSFSMMQKVLNDVLDFSKMDAGKFEVVFEPFYFHPSLKNHVLHSVSTLAKAKGLNLMVDLDPNIDLVALETSRVIALYRGKLTEEIHEGVLMGDELRLRQILTNLFSNATKFTPTGGTIGIKTKLIYPTIPQQGATSRDDSRPAHLEQNDDSSPEVQTPLNKPFKSLPQTIVVRIEVSDTGLGISPGDITDSRLFSPYVQTDAGRSQGGKGTGLGLAIVHSIVKLSKGRLGVITKKNHGSIFWIELPLGTAAVSSQTGIEFIEDQPLASVQQCGEKTPSHLNITKNNSTSIQDPEFRLCTPEPIDFSKKLPCNSKRSPENTFQHNSPAVTTNSINQNPFRSPINVPGLPSDERNGKVMTKTRKNKLLTRSLFGSCSEFMNETRECFESQNLMNADDPSSPDESKSLQKNLSCSLIDSRQESYDETSASFAPGARDAYPETNSELSTQFSQRPVSSNPTSNASLPSEAPLILSDEVQPPLEKKLFFDSKLTKGIGATLCEPNHHLTAQPQARPSPIKTKREPLVSELLNNDVEQKNHMEGDKLSILLVDDDALTRKLMSRMLSRRGHICTEAGDGSEALEKLVDRNNCFDLVMLDNFMPKKTGVEVVRELREMGRKDMICGCTANAEKDDQAEYLSAGLDELSLSGVMFSVTNSHHKIDKS